MKYLFATLMYICVLYGQCWSVSQDRLEAASATYKKNDFGQTIQILKQSSELVGIAPLLDQPVRDVRARFYFDIGRCYLALEDSMMARITLQHSFWLDPTVTGGILKLSSDSLEKRTRDFIAELTLSRQQEELTARSSWQAASRSLIFPGWGQIYRGRKKKGLFMMGATAALGTMWFLAHQAHADATSAYQATRLSDINLESRTDAEATSHPFGLFDQRYDDLKSKSSRAKFLLGSLAAVWVISITDNFIIGPGRVQLIIPIK